MNRLFQQNEGSTNYARSDLACEIPELTRKMPGVEEQTRNFSDGISVESVRILTSDASERIGKPVGNYLTLHCGKLHLLDREKKDLIGKILSEELKELSEKTIGKIQDPRLSVLTVGLGNRDLTVDAVGPATIEKINATRHIGLYAPETFEALDCCSVSAFAPGVLGQTGIETLDLVKGAVSAVKPDLVLVIDALVAGNCERLGTTIQLSDAGIVPGSGIANHRNAFDRESLGVPILSIGVPTIVQSSTLVYDALQKSGMKEFPESLLSVLETGKSYFVSPKECDLITESTSALLSDAISRSFLGYADVL